MTTAVSLLLLAATLGFAIARPRDLPEVVAAAPAAVLCVVLGLVPPRSAGHEIAVLGPTIGFLAAILLLAHLADVEGVFAYAGSIAGRISHGDPRRLLEIVFLLAAVCTATLSLDATVVLLTPVILATTTAAHIRPRPRRRLQPPRAAQPRAPHALRRRPRTVQRAAALARPAPGPGDHPAAAPALAAAPAAKGAATSRSGVRASARQDPLRCQDLES